ncbi:hypothetical protein CRUP_013920 [Coryphaenoides rupestris]|nr:hypothetical protein CRUP_013920 [Coryphaenoides rupestris]
MAIPRLVNSCTSFLVGEHGSGRTFLEKQDRSADEEEEEEEEEGGGGEEEGDNKEEGSLLAQAIQPNLSRALERGTAHCMTSEWPGALQRNPHISIVAQAEGEGSQEFSPSSTEPPFSRSLLLREPRTALVRKHSPQSELDDKACSQRRQRLFSRKHRRRPWRQHDRAGNNNQEPPIIQGLWVQEIDWLQPRHHQDPATSAVIDHVKTPLLPCSIIPPPPQFTDGVLVADPHCHGDDQALQRHTRHTLQSIVDGLERVSLLEEEEEEEEDEHTGGQSCARDSDSTPAPGGEAGGSESARWDSWSSSDMESDAESTSSSCWGLDSSSGSVPDCPDSAQNPGGTANASCTCASIGIGSQCACTVVAAMAAGGDVDERLLAGLRGRVTRAGSHSILPFFKEWEKRRATHEQTDPDEQAHEGILLHDLLQPAGWMYREGLEYDSLRHIQNGSYGDVVCIQDRKTGFQCAAKRVAQRHFSSEELSTWSALDSPHVVRLLGAVIEGPNMVLFMDLKPACLAQVLKQWVRLPEDLALHYLRQVLWALEHLHQRHVIHLDVKADNVLLSADGRNTFLCDFGLSERSDLNGQSTRTWGPEFPGTETHMAPEVARGDRRCSKADVWSSSCMLLHMLNGCPPWVRYYAPPLCLKTPLCWISPWRVAAEQQDSSEYEEAVSVLDCEEEEGDRDPHPRSLRALGWGLDCDSEVDIYTGEEEFWERRGVLPGRDRDYEGDWEGEGDEEGEEEEEEEWESSSSPGLSCALREHFPLLRGGVQRTTLATWGSEEELTHLREDVPPDNLVDPDRWSDDLSSGVFSSYNSQTDGQLEWLPSANQTSSHCFEGVDIWIEDVHDGACLRIRERRRVNVGHVAMGISDQISVKAFTLETLDRKLVSFQQEVQESGLWLCCVPAPDRCPRWYWRINNGKLDLRGAL